MASPSSHIDSPKPTGISHYENFPVASWLCPPRLRSPIAAIYHFARTADDLADEGELPAEARIQALADYRVQLSMASVTGSLPGGDLAWDPRWQPVFQALRSAVIGFDLPSALMHDLLDAFVLDVENTRDQASYSTDVQLLGYCRLSANPIGRLLLHLYGITGEEALRESDAICTALQLINFWQDPGVDLPRGRNYFTDEMRHRHGVALSDLQAGFSTPGVKAMLKQCVEQARSLMLGGAPLVHRIPGRAGWELRLVVQGGLRILDLIERQGYTTLERRPVLQKPDYAVMLWRSLWM